jgi:hypothetical protein
MQLRLLPMVGLCLLGLFPGRPAAADDRLSIGGVRFDLFGGWAYGKTDENLYLDASADGEWENANLALSARRDFSSRLRMVGQVELSQRPGESEVELDYLFLDWRPNDVYTLRLGRSKQPFGIYSEFFDLGTDRPFYDLPQSIYGPTEIVAESVDGLSFLARRDFAGSELRLEAYVGKVRFAATEPWEALEEGEEILELEEEDIDREETVGFRLEWQNRTGFTAGVSAFRGEDTHGGDEEEFGKARGVGGHLMWDTGVWLVRAEAVHFEEEGNLDIEAAYLEAARHFGEHWQAALRWDYSTTEVEEADLEESGAEELGEHRDLALGVNYWVNPGLVIKLSHHWVEGERFLAGGEIGTPEANEARMVRLGVQFLY